MTSALSHIQGIASDDQQWQETAIGVLVSELSPVKQRLEVAVKPSPALSALRVGTRSLAYSALGVATGTVAGGNLSAGMIGAGAGKGIEFVVDYLRGLEAHRKQRAVLDLAIAFRDPAEPS